jgi:hypothetical protein
MMTGAMSSGMYVIFIRLLFHSFNCNKDGTVPTSSELQKAIFDRFKIMEDDGEFPDNVDASYI